MAIDTLADLLLGATIVLSLLLAVLFGLRGLHRLYPVFFFYWIFDVLQSTVPLLVGRQEARARFQVGFLVIQCVIYFLLVLELVDRILDDHPGLARVGRRLVQVAMVVAAAGAVYTLRFDSTPQSSITEKVQLLLQLERVVTSCLLLFLLAIMVFLWIFPVRLSRNTKAYCWGFTLFFLVDAIAPFLINIRGASYVDEANILHLAGALLCQLMWLFAITKRGAERTPAFPRSWSTVEQQKVLATLDSFEQQISRTRGR